MPNVRIIAKGQRGEHLTKLKVNFAPEQSTVPSLYPETESVYLRRATEGTGELMELVGGTVAWNQLAQNGNFASTTGWSTQNAYASFSVSGNIGTMSLIVNPPNAYTPYLRGTASLANVQNHVVLFRATIKPDRGGYFRVEYAGGGFGARFNTPLTANAWNNVEKVLKRTSAVTENDIFTTYPENMVTNGWVSGDSWQIKNFTAVDLTQMFDSAIADYVYSLERSTAGSGIAWLQQYGYFTEDYYAFSNPTLQSVEATSHVTKDANNTTIATYPLDSDLVLRGIPKLDNGLLSYDGDTYEWDGTVTRKYGKRAYQAGDESLIDAITDGTNTVYKLTTPTTESADPFTAVQTVEDGGTEEFTTSNGVPVGVVGRFANAVPMEGVDSFTVTADDGTTHTYPVTLSEEIYRGYVDMLTGEAVSDMASIAEYNGETISEPWLSSLDVYSAGATPTNGAQVVYPITPEEVTATITGDPTELGNVVSVSSTEGTVDWSEMAPLDGKCIVRVVS